MKNYMEIITVLLLTCLLIVPTSVEAMTGDSTGDHLSRALTLYDNGEYGKSFEELTAHVGENRYCAVAYYYRARIRIMKGDYRRAQLSLNAAFRDSTGYADAHALHAYILRETGNTNKALTEWKRFLALKGDTAKETGIESIVLPEVYNEKKAQERERYTQENVAEKMLLPVSEQTIEIASAVKENESPVQKKESPAQPQHNHSRTLQLTIALSIAGSLLFCLYHFLYVIPRKRREMFIDEYIAYPDADKFANEVFIFKPEENKIYITYSDGKQKAKSIYNYIA